MAVKSLRVGIRCFYPYLSWAKSEIWAFQLADSALATSHPKPADDDKTVGKYRESNVSRLHFVAQPHWREIMTAGAVGIIGLIIGGFLLLSKWPLHFIGGILIFSGIYFAVYGSNWLMWWAK
jgi:hypothetical protein